MLTYILMWLVDKNYMIGQFTGHLKRSGNFNRMMPVIAIQVVCKLFEPAVSAGEAFDE
ncbi:hypothetical protein D3C84_1025070 [compost metagenome]